MARSSYIYVVRNPLTKEVCAAFTVKHELIGFLKYENRWDYLVTRVRDGRLSGETFELDIQDLMT